MTVWQRLDCSYQNSIKKREGEGNFWINYSFKTNSDYVHSQIKIHFSQKLCISTPTTNQLIFNQARNSPHWINLSFPTSTPLPENPSTSHPLFPPLPNSKGDNKWYHTPPSSLAGWSCTASVPSMDKVMPHLSSEDLYFTTISLCELKLLSCHFTPARETK